MYVLFMIGLFVQVIPHDSQLCQNQNLKILAKTQTPSTDFEPLFTMDRSTFGVTFHTCSFHCDKYQQCIGFEVCKVNEGLFRCRACCQWKIRKNYDILGGFSVCTFYGKVIDFGTNLALNKNATFSPQLRADTKPSIAVDGIKTCPDPSFLAATDQWLLIQLGDTYNIKMIVVYTGLDKYARYSGRYQIQVNVKDENFNHICGGVNHRPTFVNEVIEFPCAAGTNGSDIFVSNTDISTSSLLFWEIEVLGHP